jgi:chromate transporter
MNPADLIALFVHCATLSLLAIGGAIATVPDLQRFVVVEHAWLPAADFTASVALAQAAPGPNLLFVAVVGFNALGLPGAIAAMAGILLPSTTLTLLITRWGARRRDSRGVRAFVAGMAPITLGLLVSTGWLLASPVVKQPVAVLLVLATVVAMWKTRLSPLWLLAAGALAGALGWV